MTGWRVLEDAIFETFLSSQSGGESEVMLVGNVVPPCLVVRLYSEDFCEDGITVLRMFDLADGRSGIQDVTDPERSGPIRYAD